MTRAHSTPQPSRSWRARPSMRAAAWALLVTDAARRRARAERVGGRRSVLAPAPERARPREHAGLDACAFHPRTATGSRPGCTPRAVATRGTRSRSLRRSSRRDSSPPAADGTWRAPRGEGWPLPADLREAVALRLERLGAETRSVLDAAAVLRGDLSAQLLRAVTGLPSARVAAAIEELIGRRLLRAPTPDTLEFPHEFTARVAYERLTPEQRTALHARAASALAAHAPPDETVPSMVAYHRDLPGSRSRRGVARASRALARRRAADRGRSLRSDSDGSTPRRSRGIRECSSRPSTTEPASPRSTSVGDMAADWVTQGLAANRSRAGRRSPERPSGRDDGARRGVERLRSVQR